MNKEELNQRIVLPSYGFLSGLATFSVFFAYGLLFVGIMFFALPLNPWLGMSLLVFGRLKSDFVFWLYFFPTSMDSGENDEHWRTSVKTIVLTQPTVTRSILDLLIDAFVDAWLLYIAFCSSLPPIWICLMFTISQIIGGFFQGVVIHFFGKPGIRKASMIITVVASAMILEVSGVFPNALYSNMLGLSFFSKEIQMLIILGSKWVLAANAVIAKAIIAEVINYQTHKSILTTSSTSKKMDTE